MIPRTNNAAPKNILTSEYATLLWLSSQLIMEPNSFILLPTYFLLNINSANNYLNPDQANQRKN